MTNDFNPEAPGQSGLKSIMSVLDIGRKIDPRNGPMALWFLSHIAKREAFDDHVGREELALMAAPMSRSMAYILLDLLERDGYIQRFQDPRDHKRRPIGTTPKGRDILNQAAPPGAA